MTTWKCVLAVALYLIMFVCHIVSTFGQLITELFPDCLRVMLFALVFHNTGRVMESMR